MPKVIFVQIDEATAEYFDEPPSPVDYAAFFNFIKASQPRCVAAVDLLQWPGAEPTLVNGLVTKTRDLDLVFAVMLDNDASDPDLEQSLASFPRGIALEGAVGEVAPFKSVATKLDSALLADKVTGFTRIDFGQDLRVTANGVDVPLLAIGPEESYALSLPLVLAGRALGVDWNEVSITVGEVIDFGGVIKPISLGEGGTLSMPTAAPESLLRVSGTRLLDDEPLEAGQDAVLIVGSDREQDRVLTLSDGSQVSRGELVARAVHRLLSEATAPDPEPIVIPEPVPEPLVVKEVPPAIPANPGPVHRFPDLRAPNIGLWVLGIVGGLALGCLLLCGGRKTKKAETQSSPEELKPAAPKEKTVEPEKVKEEAKASSKPKEAAPESKENPENVPESKENPQKPKPAQAKSSLPPSNRRKKPARKKRPRSKRRRPS